jgi:pilus assembly protein FimV
MHLRTKALLFSIIALLYSGIVSALGLGEIKLNSQFNQPLNAEIRLLKVRDLTEDEILVALASREDFRRAGVDREFFLTGLKFEVVLDNPSNPYIKVTTRKPVTEPYLNFLLEVQWPSGRLLREYTLLLDLPVFAEEGSPSQAVTAPSSANAISSPGQAAPVVRSGNNFSSPSTTSSNNYRPPVSRSSVDSYRVRSGDTLWEIAESVRPDRSISVHQTMIAIQRANPDAFVGGNINRLRNGRVLRVPSFGEITDISYNQAVASVRQQTQNWSSQNQQRAVLTSSTPSTSTSGAASQPQGRLTLGSADSSQGDVKGTGQSGAGESLQNDLAIANEELDRTRRENSELQSRISDLEEQIQTMEKLVKVTNDQLKALELTTQGSATDATDSSSVSEQADTDSTTASSTEAAAEEEPTVSATDTEAVVESIVEEATSEASPEETVVSQEAEESQLIGADEVTATEPETVEEPQAVTAQQPAPALVVKQTDNSFMGFIKRNLLAIGGALLALLLGIFAFLKLREKPEETDFDEYEYDSVDDLLEEEEVEDFSADADIDEDSILEDEEDFEHDSIEAQTEDVVAEADIYVSLGQEDKAIELLQKEIHENPDNADARLGLLKIHAKSQDSAAFDEQYAQLLPLGNVYANDQATALRKEIAGIEPFDTQNYSSDVDENLSGELADLDTDLDFSNDLDDAEVSTDELTIDNDFDFSDSVEDGLASAEDSLDSTADDLDFSDDLDDELDLDLDLDLDDDDALSDMELSDTKEELTADLADNALEDDLSFDLSKDESFEELSNDLELDFDEGITAELREEALDDDNLDIKLDDDLELLGVEGEQDDGTNLDLDIDDEYAKSLEELEAADTAIAIDTDNELGEIEFEPVSADSKNNMLDTGDSLEAGGDLDIGDSLDLEAPPTDDFDMESLDQEIDAMTAELDDTFDLESTDLKADDINTEEAVQAIDDSTSELELESIIEEAEAEVDDNLDINAESFSSEEDIDLLANSEIESTSLPEVELETADDNLSALTDKLDDQAPTVNVDDSDISLTSDDELDFLETSDEVSTKLDLAKAYLDMGDREGAEDILGEVIEEGTDEQKDEAQQLMRSM